MNAGYCYPGVIKKHQKLNFSIRVFRSGSVYAEASGTMRKLSAIRSKFGLDISGPEGEKILVTFGGEVFVGDEIAIFEPKKDVKND